MTMHDTTQNQAAAEGIIDEEAAAWSTCLRDPNPDPHDPYHDPAVRNRAFFAWVLRSPAHLRAYMETAMFTRQIESLGPEVFNDLQALDEAATTTAPTPRARHLGKPAPGLLSRDRAPLFRPWMGYLGAFAVTCVALVVFLYLHLTSSEVYATPIGESHPFQLRDGSVVQLNTNSRIKVNYVWNARNIQLLRGEAFFTVTHEGWRPFIVESHDATVRAVGTEFDVRIGPQATDVVVVSGTVQVGALPIKAAAGKDTAPPPKVGDSSSAAIMLTSGESAEVANGSVTKTVGVNIAEALSWRRNRMVFSNKRLADAVDEINRYNLAQIRIEDSRARETRVSGIFPGARVQDFIVVAQQIDTLSVVPDGANWIIRSRR
jgi:transmembrane sensor